MERTDFLADLGFVLAIDNCRRGCMHCPAFGSRAPVQRTPFDRLAQLAGELASAYQQCHMPVPKRTIHCWRISDPLDYWSSDTAGKSTRTLVDVASLWSDQFGQGLYVVTNGSEGRRRPRASLEGIAARPELVSQVKLTVTPFDKAWGSQRYLADIANDLSVLKNLWDLPSTRAEDRSGRRFRVNAKVTPATRDETMEFLRLALRAGGWSTREACALLRDDTRICFKPVYDLGSAGGETPVAGAIDIRSEAGMRFKPTESARSRLQYGIRPSGQLFEVDMYRFQERDLPLVWGHQGVVAAA
jgi:hypothetical protein